MDLANLKVADLKRELKSRGLSTDGTKSILVERYREALLSTHEDSTMDDEALIDDEDSMLDEDDSDEQDGAISGSLDISELDLTKPKGGIDMGSPKKTTQLQQKSSPTVSPAKTSNQNGATEDPTKKKKILINRDPVQVRPVPTTPTTAPETKVGATATTPKSESETQEKKIIKITPPANAISDKIQMRKQKFGLNNPTTTTQAATGGNLPTEKMKQRAERFGVASSASSAKSSEIKSSTGTGKVALKTEEEAKIAARAKRFGDDKVSAVDAVDAKKKRAERFGSK